jgi:nicotinate-nucleotide adenylyltransferase
MGQPKMGQPCVGLLGGSFDPIHTAHITLAQAALANLHAQSVQLIPAAAPWQRSQLATSPEHRAAMVALAIEGHKGLALNRIEIERGGPSYTVDTLRALTAGQTSQPPVRYVWILGADQLANFCTWKDWQQIIELADLAVAARPGSQPEAPQPLAQALHKHDRSLHRLSMPEMPVSASEIRERLAHGASVDGLVPPAVLRYIAQHRLYQV